MLRKMRVGIVILSTFLFLAASAAAAVAQTGQPGGQPGPNLPTGVTPGGPPSFVHVCPGPEPPGSARFHSIVVSDRNANPAATSSPTGNNPADLQSAYKLPSSAAGGGQTVAIVDAYDNPNAESDLGVYRQTFGLPPCTTGNGCFKKVNQNGVQGSYPRGNTGWGEEIALDLDMVSAICPSCKILLVEATSNSFANLAAAVDTAALLHANAISNSYGGSEYSNEVIDQSHYNHPGVTASSGDSGYGVEFPAASQYVTAVGGTSLRGSIATGWSETVWSGAGSGCSAYIPRPAWQTGSPWTGSSCTNRTVADVAAVADPSTGVSVYDTYMRPSGGWLVFGGTSVPRRSSPRSMPWRAMRAP